MLPEITRNIVSKVENFNVKYTNIIFRVKLRVKHLILTTETLGYFDPQLLVCLALTLE